MNRSKGKALETPGTLLARAISAGPAVAATWDGRLVGYMAGLPVPGLRASGTSVYLPEWAHGAQGDGRPGTSAISTTGWLVRPRPP